MKRIEATKLIVDAAHMCMRDEEWVSAELAVQLLGRVDDSYVKKEGEKLSEEIKKKEGEKKVSPEDVTLPWIPMPKNVRTTDNQMMWAVEVFCNSLLSMEQYEPVNHVLNGLFGDDEYYKRAALSLRENPAIGDYLEWIMLHVLLASDLSKEGKVRNGGFRIGNFIVKLEEADR